MCSSAWLEITTSAIPSGSPVGDGWASRPRASALLRAAGLGSTPIRRPAGSDASIAPPPQPKSTTVSPEPHVRRELEAVDPRAHVRAVLLPAVVGVAQLALVVPSDLACHRPRSLGGACARAGAVDTLIAPVRILLTIHHALDANTGAPGVTVQLAAALEALGHEAQVYSWSDLPATLGARTAEASFPAWASARIRRAAREGVDVVDASTCDAWPWLLARRALRADRRGPAIVTRTHGLEHTFREARTAAARQHGVRIGPLERGYHGFWRLREAELTLRLADAALFLNAADRDRAVRELAVPSARAHIVANGIPDDFATLPPPVRRDGAPLRLVQLGNWDPQKGIAATAEAVGGLLAAQPGAELLVLGSGSADPGGIRAAFPDAVRERVEVRPAFDRAALPELMRGYDILVQPSLSEGFSLALLEGMACGLAPVAARVGAAADVIADGGSGLLVEPGDAPSLRRALDRLAADRELLERLRHAAQAAARDFAWSRVAADTAALYERVAAERR